MKRYNVLKDCVINHKFYQCGTVYTDNHPKGDKTYIDVLSEHGFIKSISEVSFKQWNKTGIRSKLAGVIIAPEDYTDGDKKYFTWDEAIALQKDLPDGWRLPTRSEWALICEEFAQKDGRLDADTLVTNLNIQRNGWYDFKDKVLYFAGNYGYYWSSTPYSNGTSAYYLYFDGSGVTPSNYSNRYRGYSLRLVRDLEKEIGYSCYAHEWESALNIIWSSIMEKCPHAGQDKWEEIYAELKRQFLEDYKTGITVVTSKNR